MQLINGLPLLGVLAINAQHIDIVIPQTEHYVASMLSRFSQYTDYTATATSRLHPLTPVATAAATQVASPAASCSSFWMENIAHQGKAAFNNDNGYAVFRNVRSFGAKGDGVTDDTAAINNAISSGNRFGPAAGVTSTNTPAVVYFPAGTYLISSSIIDYYLTQIIGNPNCLPVLKATPGFTGFGLIDGDQYQSSGNLGFGATNVFYRQVRNMIFDMTAIPASSSATGIHWPTAQATSLQNLIFKMSSNKGTQHQGVFIESGSGGFVTDLVFQGGLYGMNQGNQQFTMRNLTFSNCVTAISQIWDWGWTYQGININNCSIGIDMSSGGSSAQSVAAIVVLDSAISNTPVGIKTAHNATSLPASSGSLVLENVAFSNVGVAVQRTDGSTALAGAAAGSTSTIKSWAQGHRYNPTGPQNLNGNNVGTNPRPASLVSGGKFYVRSKPQYGNLPASSFMSVRSGGAVGNGMQDDTAAVQKTINAAAAAGKVCFLDSGMYLVTSTISIPAGSKIVGEAYPIIISAGSYFNNVNAPKPVLQVGKAGQSGTVEMSDLILSTRAMQAGAILLEWNLASPSSAPSGLWDVHTRIGGFIGSDLQGDTCPTTPNTVITSANYVKACVGAYMSMHATPSASGLYMENNWFWTADHDIDANVGGNQITIYTGRGLLIQSKTGTMWLYGTSIEHHSMYQYQLSNTTNIVMGQIQTETAYYQPNPNATIPFPRNAALGDPVFPTASYTTGTNGVQVPNAEGFGLRVVGSSNILVYGAGLYSFFNDYSTTCSDQGNDSVCQSRIVSLEGGSSAYIYDLHTVGTRVMLQQNGIDRIDWAANQAGFTDEVAVFKPGT